VAWQGEQTTHGRVSKLLMAEWANFSWQSEQTTHGRVSKLLMGGWANYSWEGEQTTHGRVSELLMAGWANYSWQSEQTTHGRVSKLHSVNHMQPTIACKWIMHSLQSKSVLKKCSNNFNNLCTTVSVWYKIIQGYNNIIINTYF